MKTGITAPGGFEASAVHCGVKKDGKLDLALIVSRTPARAAGLFTTNRVQAAPVAITREHLANGSARAVVVNSGNANACTGTGGRDDAERMARETAGALGIEPGDVLVASTGVIGVRLPIDLVSEGIRKAAASLGPDSGPEAAEAIMTTDKWKKETALCIEVGGKKVTIGGMAKGAGMIDPHLATMLAFLSTDAAIERRALALALERAAAASFNAITVDGDMSTNDTLLVLANGEAGNEELREGQPAFEEFCNALAGAAGALAREIVRDGEGATRLVTVRVTGAQSEQDARKVAEKIAGSPLVKTAACGADANWGRVIAAAGAAGVELDPGLVDIDMSGIPVARSGTGVPFDEKEAASRLQEKEVEIAVELHQGNSRATVWTCDLTEEYIRINAHYRS